MSVGPDPQGTMELIEKTNQEINLIVEEIARMSEKDMAPADYFGEFLKNILTVLVAPAGAVWLRTAQGNLQLQYQINMGQIALDSSESGRQSHDELLRQAIQQARPGHFPPHSSAGQPEGTGPTPGNPTDFAILVAPILMDKQVAGIVEVWQSPNRHPRAMRGFLQFLVRMAALASRYLRNHQLRQMMGQQQIWTQLETFARQIHSTLNPTEVAYLVANEGRRLVECDRITVGVRQGKHFTIEAISGADVVEKRSNLVQLMRGLCESVVTWGERLVYSGNKDDALPPAVLKALDDFLGESHSKLLVVLPLRDEREKESKKPVRSVLMMESFEPAASPEQLVAQLEVVGRHAASALYNALEHRRIPMRWVWMPLARLQEGLGGKVRAIMAAIAVALVIFLITMVIVPYPLKMEAKGSLLPEERRWIFSPWPARVVDFQEGVQPGSPVEKDQSLVLMYDVELQERLIKLDSEIQGAQSAIDLLNKQITEPRDSGTSVATLSSERKAKEVLRDQKILERDSLRERTNSDERPGYFWLKAPFKATVLNSGFRENLTNRQVKPSDPLLRVGDKDKRWEGELKIPQKHIGQVLAAFSRNKGADLDVDLLLTSDPTRTYRGKLARDRIGGQASPNKDDNNESEPVVLAWVRIDGADIPAPDQIPADRLVTGVEIHSKIRCGNRAMGYSLFYGVWEFFYEKIVFFF